MNGKNHQKMLHQSSLALNKNNSNKKRKDKNLLQSYQVIKWLSAHSQWTAVVYERVSVCSYSLSAKI